MLGHPLQAASSWLRAGSPSASPSTIESSASILQCFRLLPGPGQVYHPGGEVAARGELAVAGLFAGKVICRSVSEVSAV